MHCSAFASDLGSAPLSRIPWTARAANARCLFSCPLSRDNVASCFRCAESSRTFLAICIGSFFSFSCVSSPHAGERFADGQSCWRLHVAPCPKSLWRRPALIPHPCLPLPDLNQYQLESVYLKSLHMHRAQLQWARIGTAGRRELRDNAIENR